MPSAGKCLIPAQRFARDCTILRDFTGLPDFKYRDIFHSALWCLLSGFLRVVPIHHTNQLMAVNKSHLITIKYHFLPLDMNEQLPVTLKRGTNLNIRSNSMWFDFLYCLVVSLLVQGSRACFQVSVYGSSKITLSKLYISILMALSPKRRCFHLLGYPQHTGRSTSKKKTTTFHMQPGQGYMWEGCRCWSSKSKPSQGNTSE